MKSSWKTLMIVMAILVGTGFIASFANAADSTNTSQTTVKKHHKKKHHKKHKITAPNSSAINTGNS